MAYARFAGGIFVFHHAGEDAGLRRGVAVAKRFELSS
ncbi:unnamed protein product [Spirodela intermedia]|uniref:Uncharacterized protein n=1 Tax=Spirodela intermedia TaxID=51605 RepID=A0A7I8KTN8_SPIIN|nr:unnamed protein product [Spirodela intermedia]